MKLRSICPAQARGSLTPELALFTPRSTEAEVETHEDDDDGEDEGDDDDDDEGDDDDDDEGDDDDEDDDEEDEDDDSEVGMRIRELILTEETRWRCLFPPSPTPVPPTPLLSPPLPPTPPPLLPTRSQRARKEEREVKSLMEATPDWVLSEQGDDDDAEDAVFVVSP